MDERREEALLKEYSEVCQNFRLLTDIRFKLLAVLPIASAVAVALKTGSATAPWLGLSLFGLIVTLGLVTYNMRNDQLYDVLVGRAATIERSLGLPDGGFAQRPRPWLVIDLGWKKWNVDHRTGVHTIYVASGALWLFGVFASVLEYARQAYVGLGFPSRFIPEALADPSIWVNLTAFGLTALVTYRAVKAIQRQRDTTFKALQESACRAVQTAMPLKLSELQKNGAFLQNCAILSGAETKVERKKIRDRLQFYAELHPNLLNYYMLQGSNHPGSDPGTNAVSASHLVALLTDLPGRWIYVCWRDLHRHHCTTPETPSQRV
jgi:hypothetical protein